MSPAYLTQDPQQLLEMVRKLEMRLARLERILDMSGGDTILTVGNSSIKVQPNKLILSSSEIHLVSNGRISVKASGQLIMKGSKIAEN